MGGGGAMRAAAKVAGIGVSNGGMRAFPSVFPSEHPVTAAARKATRAASVAASSPDDVKPSALVASEDGKIDASVQRPCWEIDDWEFADGDKELMKDFDEPMPRLVFGAAPTLQEAEEATSELKDALNKAYLSPCHTGYGGSFISSGQESSLLLLSNSEYLETKACVTSETPVTPTVSKHAIQAFRFLNESPVAQNVVASIASDPDVWNAVLKNEALVEFLHSHQISAASSHIDANVKESVADADFLNPQSPKCFDESCVSGEAVSGNGFLDVMENIRGSVVEMMNSLSGFFRNLFVGPVSGEASSAADASARETFVDRALGASFMGLAIMVIMVVVLKRV